MLDADARLWSRPSRVLVAGTSGSGKTTLAIRIAGVLGVPHTEIDALYHGPGWIPRADFSTDIDVLIAQPGWVTEWQYSAARARLAAAADLMVWLDLPRRRVMWQVSLRTLRRRWRRERLWNGNVEPPLRTFLTDRDHIVRWAWRTHALNEIRVDEVLALRPDLRVVRLTSHRAAEKWLRGPLSESAV
jgi:adenylate kinase family enzyme